MVVGETEKRARATGEHEKKQEKRKNESVVVVEVVCSVTGWSAAAGGGGGVTQSLLYVRFYTFLWCFLVVVVWSELRADTDVVMGGGW